MRLHEKGLVYRGSDLGTWSPTLQPAVSDLEVTPLPFSSPPCIWMPLKYTFPLHGCQS